jgi:hypothetical protein
MILANKKTLRGTISQLRRPEVPLRLPLFGHAEKELGLKFAQTNVKIAEYILHTTEEEFRCFFIHFILDERRKACAFKPRGCQGTDFKSLDGFLYFQIKQSLRVSTLVLRNVNAN